MRFPRQVPIFLHGVLFILAITIPLLSCVNNSRKNNKMIDMSTKSCPGLCLGLICTLLTVYGHAQETPPDLPERVQQVLSDSAIVPALLDHIVLDSGLRTQVLAKLAAFASTHPDTLKGMVDALSAIPPAMQDPGGPEILVKFKQGTTPERIRKLAAKHRLYEIKAIPQLRIRVYRIGEGRELNKIISQCQREDCVEYAEGNQPVGAH